MLESESSSDARVSCGGYSASVQGTSHQLRRQNEALVRLARDATYKLVFTNAYDSVCAVNVEIDGIQVGNFYLQRFSECVVERPADRPLGFVFSPSISQFDTDTRGPVSKLPASSRRTNVVCTFLPEMGAQTIELDVRAHHLGLSWRLEMPNSCTAKALFAELVTDFGDWVTSGTCALIHWTSAECDSPVEDVFTSDMQTELRTCRRLDEPIRKMSLINAIRLHLKVCASLEPNNDNSCGATAACIEKSLDLHQVATFGMVLDLLTSPDICLERQFADTSDLASRDTWYFLSQTGRLLGSTDWIKSESSIYQILHKSEILADCYQVHLQATRMRPASCMRVYGRVLRSASWELEASLDTTVRELRLQLACLGGPWGEDPCWLFGGKLLDSQHTLKYYGIGENGVIDIVLRLNNQGERPLTRHNPIVIEQEKEIDTACLIRKAAPAVTSNAKSGKSRAKDKESPRDLQRRLHRGGTVLKGRCNQQFLEVSPIEGDERFKTTIVLCLLPEGETESVCSEDSDRSSHRKQLCLIN